MQEGLDCLNDAETALTELLIKQDVKDKKSGKIEMREISQVDMFRLEIKLIKMLKKYLLCK